MTVVPHDCEARLEMLQETLRQNANELPDRPFDHDQEEQPEKASKAVQAK